MSAKMDERLKKALARTRVAWWILMIAFGFFVGTSLPVWGVLLIIPFAFLSYALLLYITINILAATIPPEEIAEADAELQQKAADKAKLEAVAAIAERQAKGEEVPPDEVMEALNKAGVVEVVKVSSVGPVIGHFKDKEIYEYILVTMPKYSGDTKMMYYGPANIVDGIAQIPVIDGMIFASVENILYAYEVPAESK